MSSSFLHCDYRGFVFVLYFRCCFGLLFPLCSYSLPSCLVVWSWPLFHMLNDVWGCPVTGFCHPIWSLSFFFQVNSSAKVLSITSLFPTYDTQARSRGWLPTLSLGIIPLRQGFPAGHFRSLSFYPILSSLPLLPVRFCSSFNTSHLFHEWRSSIYAFVGCHSFPSLWCADTDLGVTMHLVLCFGIFRSPCARTS